MLNQGQGYSFTKAALEFDGRMSGRRAQDTLWGTSGRWVKPSRQDGSTGIDGQEGIGEPTGNTRLGIRILRLQLRKSSCYLRIMVNWEEKLPKCGRCKWNYLLSLGPWWREKSSIFHFFMVYNEVTLWSLTFFWKLIKLACHIKENW